VERRCPVVELNQQQLKQALGSLVPNARLYERTLATSGRANTNYFLDTDQGRFVLRVHARDALLGVKEQALYQLAHESVPMARVVGTVAAGAVLEHAFSLLEFVPGDTLEDVIRSGTRDRLENAGYSLDKALAQLARHAFETTGDLLISPASGVLVVEPWPFTDFDRWALFESPAGTRLGTLRDELWQVLRRARGSHPDTSPVQLVHGDFNPSNLLLDESGELTAVLDWEFAHAGTLWMDLGNLLRHRYALPLHQSFTTKLLQALMDHAIEIPIDWRARTLLIDISSALEFLSSPDDRPETHAAAMAQIRATMAQLSP
jgi:aminoglycoside phosphotransferase (APT) family kinase protein